MAQLMPLQLTVSCFSKVQIGFTSLVPAHPGSPGQMATKRGCVCVCVYALTSARSEVPRLDETSAGACLADDTAPVRVRASVAGTQLVARPDPGQRSREARTRTVHTDRRRRRLVHHAQLPVGARQLLTRQTLYTRTHRR